MKCLNYIFTLLHDPNAITVQFWLDVQHQQMYLWSTKTSYTNKLSPGLKIDLQFLFTNGNNKWSASFISRTPPVSRFHFVVRENFIFYFRTLSIRSLCMHPRLHQQNSTTNTHPSAQTHTFIPIAMNEASENTKNE